MRIGSYGSFAWRTLQRDHGNITCQDRRWRHFSIQ
jgi:hypothetical protein